MCERTKFIVSGKYTVTLSSKENNYDELHGYKIMSSHKTGNSKFSYLSSW